MKILFLNSFLVNSSSTSTEVNYLIDVPSDHNSSLSSNDASEKNKTTE